MRTLIAVGLMASAATLTIGAARSDLAIPRTIAEAEADGRAFSRAGSVGLDADVVGTAERKCVEPTSAAARGQLAMATQSGEMVIGGTIQLPGFAGTMQSGSKIWWAPLHGPAGTLRVRGARIDGSADTVRLEFTSVGRNAGGSFYPTNVHVPSTGHWMFVATSGRDWGCFLFRVG